LPLRRSCLGESRAELGMLGRILLGRGRYGGAPSEKRPPHLDAGRWKARDFGMLFNDGH